MLTGTSPITELKGVGAERAKKLNRLGIYTLTDLLLHYPRAYERRGNVLPCAEAPCSDASVSLLLTVATEVSQARIRQGMTVSKFRAFDDSGSVQIVFFNSPFVKQVFHVGSTFRFYGKLTCERGRLCMTAPKYEPFISDMPLDDFYPLYPLTEGISSKILSELIRAAAERLLPTWQDPLPESIRQKRELATLPFALKNIHHPTDEEALTRAMRRLAFDELFFFALGVARGQGQRKKERAVTVAPCSVRPFLELLPYELTADQKMAVNEIYRDMTAVDGDGITPPMTRILAGDVGSGKTVCAALAMYIVARSGLQSALMAPTEILARQHYNDLSPLFSTLGIRTELLLGDTKEKDRRRILAAAENAEIDVLIGTHALLSDRLHFKNLSLIVTDEQHRFGVRQRAVLKERAEQAHMLVMSATPIPRSLALAMYGDLDVSRIKEMPKGRMRVDTFAVNESYRARIHRFIEKQVADGGQCYIVCPAIEANETDADAFVPSTLDGDFSIQKSSSKLKTAVEYTEDLKKHLPKLRISCMHGRMKAAERDTIMQAFARGELDVLVSTTVIEVGVNVPNASLMIVECADRFGLSQLHQLRGRVGRGKRKSYCILISDATSEKAKERLQIMQTTYDGFVIAERDLAMRGPGDFFSITAPDTIRQSGGFSFRFASLSRDTSLLEEAAADARAILAADPELQGEENRLLRAHAEARLQQNATIS